MRLFGLAMICAAMAGTAHADNLALVISNGSYDDLPDLRSVNSEHDNLVDAYRKAGYEVLSSENLDRDEMGELIRRFEVLLEQSDGVVVHFSGHGFSAGGENWLAPQDLETDSMTEAIFDAVPLQPILELLARRPGESALFLGLADDMGQDAPFADSINVIDIPQGVMVVRGEPGAVAKAAEEDFLVAGRGANVARSRADDVTIEGYVSRRLVLAPLAEGQTPPPEPEPEPEPAKPAPEVSLVEEALWKLAEQSPTEANLGAYIKRFPNGAYIAEARRLLAEIEANKIDPAEKVEADLNLRVAQRRQVQELLTVLDYDTRGVDGIFGPGTRAAIAAWQRAEGLDPTGYLNGDQIALLQARAEVRRQQIEAEAAERRRQEELADIEFWQATGSKGTAADYRTYLGRYPDGLYSAEAKRELAALEAKERESAQVEERAFWDQVAARNTAVAYREYLAKYPNGTFAATANAKIAELTQQGNNAGKEEEYRRIENGLGLNVASVALVEQRLKMLRFDPGSVDGQISGKTRSAIKQFQRKEGMDVTGYLNSATLQRLIVASSR
jgi:peptidoglycan hydrolase-like protein with peptidoglycan-binding domain